MPPAPRPADARHSSIAFDGDPSLFALAPLGRALVSGSAPVRAYRSGAADPLPGPGVSRTFRAVDLDAWLVPALALVDLALSPAYAGPADALDGGRAPLARLVAARDALAERIAGQLTALVPGDGDLTAASAALRRTLSFSLSEAWAATAVVQLPTTVDVTVTDERSTVLELDVTVSEHGDPADVAVAPAELDLGQPRGTLDLVVHVTDAGRRRRRTLDLVLDAAVPVPLSPLAADVDPASGPWVTRIDLSVPLRAQPVPLAAVAQTAETTPRGDAEPTLLDAVAWTFGATFEVPAADQDELELHVAWNASAAPELAAAPHAADAPSGPFVALAELTDNHAAIRADLERVLPPDPDPDPEDPDEDPEPDEQADTVVTAVDAPAGTSTPDPAPDEDPTDRQRVISALTALAALAEQLAAGWRPVGPDAAVATPPGPGTATLRLAPERRPNPDGAPPAALVLRRGSATWGPENRRPRIAYEHDGELVVLDPEPAAGDPGTLRYVADPRRPPVPGERRTVALEYPGLSAVVVRSARASARTIRNADLVPDADVAPAFVLRTAEAAFARPAVPALDADEPIAIGSGPAAGFAAALTTALRALLGSGPYDGLPWVSLAVGIASRLGPDGPETTQPVLLAQPQAYDDALPVQVGAAVAEWLAQRAPVPSSAPSVSVEMRLLAGEGAAGPPLAVLRRLDYRLTP